MVVISIIGMLSSVVLVALNGARDKANVAAGITFASYNYHAFGADALFYSNFDQLTSAGQPIDMGINSLDMAIYRKNLDTGTGYGYNISTATSYNGSQSLYSSSADYLRIDTKGKISNTQPRGITLSVWLKPAVIPANGSSLILGFAGTDWGIRLDSNGKIGVTTHKSGGTQELTSSVSIDTSKWVQITTTLDANAQKVVLYVNGKPVSLTPPQDTINFWIEGTFICIMGCYAGNKLNGYVDDAAIYSTVLTADQIQNIYAIQAPKFGLAVK